MASTATIQITADQFWSLPDRPGVRLELVDGEVVELPGAGGYHATLSLFIFDLVRAYVKEHDLGLMYPDGMTYLLQRNPDVLRIPDASFIASSNIPNDWPPMGYSEVMPSLVVEVVSPSNTAAEIRRRTKDYVGAGVSLVWIVWPEDQSISVHAGTLDSTELSAGQSLDGGDVLPGFSVTVGDLFKISR